jgi:hypothetical protein
MSLEPKSFAPIASSAQALRPAEPSENSAGALQAGFDAAGRKILRHILEHSEPAPLPAAWSFLPATSRVRTLGCSQSDLVASLKRRSFSEEELQAAKILAGDSENGLQLSPVLCEDKFQVLSGADHEPLDLASDGGLLLGDQPPCFHFACQRHGAADGSRVFVSALEDLQILECLGLRCTPAAGLAHLNGQQVRRLYANLSPSSRPRYRLTLVGASIANLENKLPSHIAPILDRFHEAQVLFEPDENDDIFELWRPSADDFDRICAAVRFSDREIIRREIRASVDDFVLDSSCAWHQLHEPDLADLESAHAELIRAIRNPYDFGHALKTAKARVSQAINALTTRRFLQAAVAASTPQESHALLTTAEIIEHLNQSYGLLSAAKPRDGFSFHFDPTLTEKRLEDIERGINLLLKLQRLSPQK